MRDFSLLYGPIRTWLPIVAFAVLAVVVFLETSSSGSPERTCEGSACQEPLQGERELLRNEDGLDIDGTVDPPADPTTDGAEPDPWDRWSERSEPDEVPFIPLQPSPESMTEAGEELVREASTG